jgi:very-short-patch-repair endonuclease
MNGVIPHELKATGHRVVTVDGLPCVSPEDTWAQLSQRLDIPELVAIGDFLVTGDEPYSGQPSPLGRAELERAVRHHGRRRGVQSLRIASELVRYGSLSPQESVLRVALVHAGLAEPELNFHVVHDDRLVAMVDLAYPDQRLAIEYLGDHHRTDADLYRADIHRRERLASIGWNTVFITTADLTGPVPRAVPLIRAALKRSSRDLCTLSSGVSRA